jgi:hypothetical protein
MAGTLNLAGGDFTLQDGAVGTGDGVLGVTGGTLIIPAGASVAVRNLTASNVGTLIIPDGASVAVHNLTEIEFSLLYGRGTVTVDGQFTWTGGRMTGGGQTVLAAGATGTISGTGGRFLARTLANAGTLDYTATGLAFGEGPGGGAGVILNTGVFNAVSGGAFFSMSAAAHSFNNAGTFNRSGPASTTVFTSGLAFNNSGTVNVTEGGSLFVYGTVAQVSGSTLTGGSWYVGANCTITLTGNITTNQGNVTLDGTGSQFAALNNLASNTGSFSLLGGRNFTTSGAWNNSGSLTVGAGSTLTVNGAFTQSASGSLFIQLAGTAAAQFSRIVVSGLATFGGTLNVTEVGGFTPAAGDTYQVMPFGSRSNDFATKNGFQLGNGRFLREDLNATDLTLEVFQAQLVFQQQPTDTTAGQSITPAVQVAIVDPATGIPIAFDNTDTVTMSLNGGGTLGGTLTETVSGGVATFADLSITQAATGYMLNADSTGLLTATSSAFAITAAAARHLVFSQQPTDTPAGQTISQVVVQVVDQFGNVITDYSGTVSLSLNDNPMTGATLSGTLTVTVVNGVATFSDLSIDLAGGGYTLHATIGGGLPDIDSDSFNVT